MKFAIVFELAGSACFPKRSRCGKTHLAQQGKATRKMPPSTTPRPRLLTQKLPWECFAPYDANASAEMRKKACRKTKTANGAYSNREACVASCRRPLFRRDTKFFPSFRRIIRPRAPQQFHSDLPRELKTQLEALLKSLSYVVGDASELSVTKATHKIDGVSRVSLQIGAVRPGHARTQKLPVRAPTLQGRARLNNAVQTLLDKFSNRHGAYITWHTQGDNGLYDFGLVGKTFKTDGQTYRVTDDDLAVGILGFSVSAEMLDWSPQDKWDRNHFKFMRHVALGYPIQQAQDDPKFAAELAPAGAAGPTSRNSITLEVGMRFRFHGKTYRVIRLNPKARKYPAQTIQEESDKWYDFPRIVEDATRI